MTWPQAFVIVGGFIAASLTIIKIVSSIWGGGMKKVCVDKFGFIENEIKEQVAEVEDTGEARRESCMERFRKMADSIQTNLTQTASLKIDIIEMQGGLKAMGQKVDDLKVDFKEIMKFIRDNLRASQRRD